MDRLLIPIERSFATMCEDFPMRRPTFVIAPSPGASTLLNAVRAASSVKKWKQRNHLRAPPRRRGLRPDYRKGRLYRHRTESSGGGRKEIYRIAVRESPGCSVFAAASQHQQQAVLQIERPRMRNPSSRSREFAASECVLLHES